MYDYSSYYDYGSTDISQYARGGLDSSVATGIGAMLGAMLGVYLMIALVIGILQIVGMWKVYSKAGEKGWKSLIPIYNLVVLFKISGISPWLIFVYFAGIIPFIGWIAVLVLSIYQCNQLAKSFGKDAGYTVGLLLLPTIFYMILGLGSSTYVGPGGKASTSDEPIDVTPEQ
jgi:hypothetical protein